MNKLQTEIRQNRHAKSEITTMEEKLEIIMVNVNG
jgi:hypothetical protein